MFSTAAPAIGLRCTLLTGHVRRQPQARERSLLDHDKRHGSSVFGILKPISLRVQRTPSRHYDRYTRHEASRDKADPYSLRYDS